MLSSALLHFTQLVDVHMWVGTGVREYVWDEFSEYLLETRFLTSGNYSTHPLRILLTKYWLPWAVSRTFIRTFKSAINSSASENISTTIIIFCQKLPKSSSSIFSDYWKYSYYLAFFEISQLPNQTTKM